MQHCFPFGEAMASTNKTLELELIPAEVSLHHCLLAAFNKRGSCSARPSLICRFGLCFVALRLLWRMRRMVLLTELKYSPKPCERVPLHSLRNIIHLWNTWRRCENSPSIRCVCYHNHMFQQYYSLWIQLLMSSVMLFHHVVAKIQWAFVPVQVKPFYSTSWCRAVLIPSANATLHMFLRRTHQSLMEDPPQIKRLLEDRPARLMKHQLSMMQLLDGATCHKPPTVIVAIQKLRKPLKPSYCWPWLHHWSAQLTFLASSNWAGARDELVVCFCDVFICHAIMVV